MIVLLLYSIIKTSRWNEIFLKAIGIGLFFAIPFLIRNYIISGYLIYPFHQLDVFSPEWKVPKAFVEYFSNDVTNWARSQSSDFSSIKMPLKEWVPHWFKLKGGLAKALILAIPFSLFILLFKYGYQKNTNRFQIAVILLINELFWFFMAPTLRFAWGIHFVLISLCTFEILSYARNQRILEKLRLNEFHIYGVIFISSLLLNVGFLYFTDYYKANGYKYAPIVIMPAPTPDVKFEIKGTGHAFYYPSESSHCTNLPLPCAPFYTKELEFLGPQLKNGFRMKKKEWNNIEIRKCLREPIAQTAE